jgi:hypothetical protein
MALWKKLFVTASILLVASLAFSGDLWFQLESLKTHPYTTPPVETSQPSSQSKIDNPATSPLDASQEIAALKTQLTAAEEAHRQTLDGYAEIRKEIHRRFGMGNDALSFITPQSPAIDSLVKEITGGYSSDSTEYWRDIDNIFRWITRNITYQQDTYTPLLPASPGEPVTWSEEFWRTPEETLKDKAGDCEDLSCLLASMILNYNSGRYSVWVVSMENQTEGHIAVALPVAGKMLTIMDPTAFYITGPNGTVLSSRDVGEAVNGWLSNMSKKVPDARIKSVFNDKFRQDFTSTQEFVSWAEKQIE